MNWNIGSTAILTVAFFGAVAEMKPTVVWAQAAESMAVSSTIATSLQSAADQGPQALLQRLGDILSSNPDIAQSPAKSAELARSASLLVHQFQGENVPVYRDIAAKVIAAAPVEMRPEISRAVAEAVRQAAAADPDLRRPLVGDIETLTAQARRENAEVKPSRGFDIGSFTIYPEAQVSSYFDDNIFATKTAPKTDFITVVSPQIYVGSNWDRHSLNFQAHTDFTRYSSHLREDSTDYWTSSEGVYDVNDATQAFAGALYGRWHEDRASPDNENGLSPTQYDEVRGYGGVSHQFGDLSVKVGGTWQQLIFDDTPTASGIILNGDRDRTHVTAGIRTSYHLNDVFEPYLDTSYDARNYRLSMDTNGFRRDSNGYRLMAGTNVRVAGTLIGEVFGGYIRQDYRSPALEDVMVPGFGGNLRWAARPDVLVTGWTDRSVQETTLFGASSYVYTSSGTTVDYNLTSNIVLTLRGAYANSTFVGSGRIDNDYEGGFGARYNFTDTLYVASDYRYQRRFSTTNFAEFDRQQIFVRAGVGF